MTRPPAPRRRHTPRRGLFVCLVLVTALGALDQTMVATALPAVVADPGTPERAPWVVAAYTLALTAAMPTAGALGDRFGRRRMLMAFNVLFVLASLPCGLAGDLNALAAARPVQGTGGAGLLTLPQAVVADAVPARHRAAYLGPLGGVFAVATVVSPLLGGRLTDTTSWRWIFWLNLPLGAAAIALVITAVEPNRPGAHRDASRTRFDIPGAVLLAATAAGIALTAACAESGWTGQATAAASTTALLASAALWWERRAAGPVLPVGILRDRPALLCCLLALVAGVGLFGTLAYVPTWVQGVHGTSATTAGLTLLPVTVGIAVGTNGSGIAVRRWGHWRIFPAAGCALSATAASALAAVSDRAVPLYAIAGLLALLGLGTGLFLQIVVVVAQDAGAAASAGKVTATMAFVREIGVLAGSAFLGALAAHGVEAHTGSTAERYGGAFASVFVTVATCFARGFAVSLLLPRHRLGEGRTQGAAPENARA